MIPSVNESVPPATPPSREARVSLSPKTNQAYGTSLRRYPFVRRTPQQTPMTPLQPQSQSLTQASARLINEGLQKHHARLHVQLQSASPTPAAPTASTPAAQSASSVKAFLDSTLRTYAARFQAELNSMRAACIQLVQREERKAAEIRDACNKLTQERDAAQEKLRVLTERRKRSRAQVEAEDAEAEAGMGWGGGALRYPPPPEREDSMSVVSPQQLPTQSPPPRLLSPFVLAVRRSPAPKPDPKDRTAFNLTVGCDELQLPPSLPRVSKRRRVSESEESERTLVGTASPEPEPELKKTKTQVRETCPPVGAAGYALGLGECDMDLESDCETSSESDARSSLSPKLRLVSGSPPVVADIIEAPQLLLKPVSTPPAPLPTPPPSAPLEKVRLDLGYVDIMYLPSDGKLVCRVCLLAATSSRPTTAATPACDRPSAIQAFIPGASWEMLRVHCEEAHPEACRDVVGLGPAGVRELRRRLGLGVAVLP